MMVDGLWSKNDNNWFIPQSVYDSNVCGKTSSLMNCKRDAKRWLIAVLKQGQGIAGAPCDICHGTEMEIGDICLSCGFLFCTVCDEDNLIRTEGKIVNFKRWLGCQQRRRFRVKSDYKKLEKLVREKPVDSRLPHWLTDIFDHERPRSHAARHVRTVMLLLGQFHLQISEKHIIHMDTRTKTTSVPRLTAATVRRSVASNKT